MREGFIHPIAISSTCPPPGRALLALWLAGMSWTDRHHRNHSADRHREEERHHDRSTALAAEREQGMPPRRRSTRPVCCVFGPILTTLAALLGACR